ncbi:MAG: two-component system response regulator AtoC, partial [Myxococcota bacterium]
RARSVIIGGIVGHSEPMRRLLRRVSRVANSVVPALVLGETGVGKELIARAIHQGSDRAEQAFVTENCGAFSESALNSELFGHEIGAFTGATRRRRGLFEQADGGTLFLDEVGELGLSAQVRLLRVLQDGTLRRMGAETPIHVDVRVVAATHRDLPAMIRAGEFREDLYYRLRGAELHVPPLRTRMSDLEPLVATLLAETARPELRLTRSAWHALQRYRWPGNVRELKAEVRRWTVFCDALVEVDDLSPEIVAASPPATVSSESAETPIAMAWPTLADTEAGAIRAAFAANDGNISRTARVLGIDRNTLKRKLRR